VAAEDRPRDQDRTDLIGARIHVDPATGRQHAHPVAQPGLLGRSDRVLRCVVGCECERGEGADLGEVQATQIDLVIAQAAAREVGDDVLGHGSHRVQERDLAPVQDLVRTDTEGVDVPTEPGPVLGVLECRIGVRGACDQPDRVEGDVRETVSEFLEPIQTLMGVDRRGVRDARGDQPAVQQGVQAHHEVCGVQ
jgi:hypothetical protein